MSVNKIFYAALTSVLMLAPMASAEATVLSVVGSLPSAYVAEGSTITGNFNTNSEAGSLGYSTPYNISGGTMTFNFSDNYDAAVTTTVLSSSEIQTTYQKPPGCSGCLPVPFYSWLDKFTTYVVDPAEVVAVSSGGMSASASSPYQNYVYVGSIVQSGHQSCGIFGCGFLQDTRTYCEVVLGAYVCLQNLPVYKQTTNIDNFYYGDFSVSINLDSVAIADLASDGLIDFTITSTLGDFRFNSATLSLTIDASGVTPVGPVDPHTVSEPETYAMTLLGFGLIGIMTRRRRRHPPAAGHNCRFVLSRLTRWPTSKSC